MDNHKELAAALVAAQAEMPAVAFDATNPFLKNKYATLGAIIEASRPVLAKHGLCVVQFPENGDNKISLRTVVMHKSGESIEGTIALPLGDEKGKSLAQVAGSIVTYLRRYSWASVLGIYADEDTDGHSPAAPTPRPAAKLAPAARPAPAAAPKAPQATAKPNVAAFKERMVKLLQPIEEIAVAFARDASILLPNEVLADWPAAYVPRTKDEMDGLLANIQAWEDNGRTLAEGWKPTLHDDDGDLGPSKPAPEKAATKAPSGECIRGYIKKVSTKDTSKGGTRYGILIVDNLDDREGGDWLNTFDDKDGELAESLINAYVEAYYTEGKYGKDLVKHGLIEPEVVP